MCCELLDTAADRPESNGPCPADLHALRVLDLLDAVPLEVNAARPNRRGGDADRLLPQVVVLQRERAQPLREVEQVDGPLEAVVVEPQGVDRHWQAREIKRPREQVLPRVEDAHLRRKRTQIERPVELVVQNVHVPRRPRQRLDRECPA